jgi:hypothetical protein
MSSGRLECRQHMFQKQLQANLHKQEYQMQDDYITSCALYLVREAFVESQKGLHVMSNLGRLFFYFVYHTVLEYKLLPKIF